MSIRHGLLALLERGPAYGYQLRAAFEESTGATWPLNIGQVYSTLARLERDGLVDAVPGNGAGGQRPYALTGSGQAELASWFSTPVRRDERPRDELAIKLALALTTRGVDVRAVIQTQRGATIRTLQELTRLKKTADDLSSLLVVDCLIFQAEAEVRWLDHCESSMARHRPPAPPPKAPAPPPDTRPPAGAVTPPAGPEATAAAPIPGAPTSPGEVVR